MAAFLIKDIVLPDSNVKQFKGGPGGKGIIMVVGLSIGGFFIAALVTGVVMSDMSARRSRKTIVKVREREE